MRKFAFFLLFAALALNSHAQKVVKLTITDNLSSASRFSYGKPKPAAPKDHFYLLSDKGTQVLFYAEVAPSDSVGVKTTLKFVAYKTDGGKDEWVDERSIELKPGQSYAMTAINFFSTGTYRVTVTSDNSNEAQAVGTFIISK